MKIFANHEKNFCNSQSNGGYFSDYLKTINILVPQKMAGSHRFNARIFRGHQML